MVYWSNMKESFFGGPSIENTTINSSKEKINPFSHFQNPDQAAKLEDLLLNGLQISDELFKELLKKLDKGIDITPELASFSEEIQQIESLDNNKEEAIERQQSYISTGLISRAGMLGLTVASLFSVVPKESYSQSNVNQIQQSVEVSSNLSSPRVIEKKDQNMPEGFKRESILDANQKQIGSLFWFDGGKASFLSNDKHPNAFDPKIDYTRLNHEVQKQGDEMVISFAGAYKSPSGNIEGVAIENGEMVGEGQFSKWSGFVYIAPNGKIEMYRAKDAQENFDVARAEALVTRAKQEKGSLFQQIPAIWNGQKKLNSSSTNVFEFRAVCQTKEGKQFVINCTEKVTQNQFLDMCLNLKDQNGNTLVYDLMLVDTGVYSYGVFRDKNQIQQDSRNGTFSEHTMVDEQYGNNVTGYTNVVVISK